MDCIGLRFCKGMNMVCCYTLYHLKVYIPMLWIVGAQTLPNFKTSTISDLVVVAVHYRTCQDMLCIVAIVGSMHVGSTTTPSRT